MGWVLQFVVPNAAQRQTIRFYRGASWREQRHRPPLGTEWNWGMGEIEYITKKQEGIARAERVASGLESRSSK